MSRPTIVHITGDYPDAAQPRKTPAVLALVEGTGDAYDHRVYSLNRVPLAARGRLARPGAVEAVADDGRVASWTYGAPARGLFLATAMARVADHILSDLARTGVRPHLVQAHKLSIEGLAALPVATALGVPYALTLQGNTDQKILSVRRDLWPRYRRVWKGATRIFPFAPWIYDWCAARLGQSQHEPIILPCILAHDELLPPVERPPLVVSAFHLEHHKLKNLSGLVEAAALAAGRVPGLTLEIGGDGPVAATAAVDAAIAGARADGFARRVGRLAPADIQNWMNCAAAFAMPSHHETFGMVFVEALLGGCPIVYPKDRAVEGYFDGCGFALGVPPRDTAAIADAIATLLTDQVRRKAELARWQASPAAAAFRRDAILSAYRGGLAAALGRTPG